MGSLTPVYDDIPVQLAIKFIKFAGLTYLNRSQEGSLRCGNDPSAGSPTETLLRLHLPLNSEV